MMHDDPTIRDERFLSAADCASIGRRVVSYARGGGATQASVQSWWTGSATWARNRISLATDQRLTSLYLSRYIRGSGGSVSTNQLDDTSLKSAITAAEYLTRFKLQAPLTLPNDPPPPFTYLKPKVWSDATYTLSAEARERIVRGMTDAAETAGLVSAGQLETRAGGIAIHSSSGLGEYCPVTGAECSLTVRDSAANASGWAGESSYDWARIDHAALLARAMDKCIRSRNPVAVEPGRWTVILEPQAVYDLISVFIRALDRKSAEESPFHPLHDPSTGDSSRLGQKIANDLITISHDPMHPDLGVVPFTLSGEPIRPATWIEKGRLINMGYDRQYAISLLNDELGFPNTGAFQIVGGSTSLDEMIQSTRRGLLITRFSSVTLIDPIALLCSGTTRDGTWLVENGKIAKPVKNFRFVESPLFALNNVEQVGTPVRPLTEYAPALVPPLKIRDFNFPSLADAI